MKIRIPNIISSIAFIAIAQLLFFWLIPTSHEHFWITYPFYTIITLANTLIAFWLGVRYKFPVSFAPIITGSTITTAEMIISICMLLLCSSSRSILFVQLIITMIYVLAVTLFASIAIKESANSSSTPAPVTPFPESNTCVPPSTQSTARRKVTSINS